MTIKDDKTHIDLVEHLAEGVSIIREKPGEPQGGEPPAEAPLPENQPTASKPAAEVEK